MCSTAAAGVRVGASMPHQISLAKPGNADSATVGNSGVNAERAGLVTASARRFSHNLGADGAARAAAIVDHHRLSEGIA